MWRGLPITTWVLLVASIAAGPAVLLLRRFTEARRGRRDEAGPAEDGRA